MRVIQRMKTSLMIFLLAFPLLGIAENTSVPKFQDYPVSTSYIGNPAKVVLSSDKEKSFRTRLTEASKQKANFAGEYVVTGWGCGTSCIHGAAVSLKTGRVVFWPGSICCWEGDGERLDFRINSRLIVAAGRINEGDEYGAHFYEFTGSEFKHIKTIPIDKDLQLAERMKANNSLEKNASSITMDEARALIMNKFSSDKDYANNPSMLELARCTFEGPLNEIFNGGTEIENTIFERRMITVLDRYKNGPDMKDPSVVNNLKECISNSSVLGVIDKSELVKAINKAADTQATSATLTDIDDLKLDIASMEGRKVRVQGVGNYLMDIFMLKKSATDMSPMLVDISKLQRDQRRKILQQCADIVNGCRLTVYGTVGKVSFQNGIIAENVQW
ncbi:MAG: hypothetical protein Q8Q57_04775 [Methylotenera sp.]|nr:hypothetical protein [Methylotenera sp.]